MWESYDLGNEDFLWAGIPFMGGISGQQQAPCGAISASAVSLALRHRSALNDKVKAKQSRAVIRHHAGEIVRSFREKFGDIACLGLVEIDFSKPGEYRRFRESGIWKDKCENYIRFSIEKLYEFEDGEGTGR